MHCVVQNEGKGIVLDQFGNLANPLAHYKGTGPEVWEQTKGRITHFVSSMGTTGTIMGTSKYLKEQNPDVRIVGLQPREGSAIAGIRRWPKEYLPTIFQVTVRLQSACEAYPTHLLVACQSLGSRFPGFYCVHVDSLATIWASQCCSVLQLFHITMGNTQQCLVLVRLGWTCIANSCTGA